MVVVLVLLCFTVAALGGAACGCGQSGLTIHRVNRNPLGTDPLRKLHNADHVLVVEIINDGVVANEGRTLVFAHSKVVKALYGDAKQQTVTVRQMVQDRNQPCLNEKTKKLEKGKIYVLSGSQDGVVFYVDPCFATQELSSMKLSTSVAFPRYSRFGGMSPKHKAAFQSAANSEGVVYITRALNSLSTDLIMDFYAPKGFFIKSKSCDWGPMAGFVSNDPRFTKASANEQAQRASIVQAFDEEHFCSVVPLFITQRRITNLARNGLIQIIRHDPGSSDRPARYDVLAERKGKGVFSFVLLEADARIAAKQSTMKSHTFFGVYYGQSEEVQAVMPSGQKNRPHNIEWKVKGKPIDYADPALRPVYGLTNPEGGNFKFEIGLESLHADWYNSMYPTIFKAVAGDYDMWAYLDDATKATADPNYWTYSKPTKNLGAISPAVEHLGKSLNQRLKQLLVVHSDYGGFPGFTMDYPLMAFVPNMMQSEFDSDPLPKNQAGFCLQDLTEVAYFLRLMDKYFKYCVTRANPRLWWENYKASDGSFHENFVHPANRGANPWLASADLTYEQLTSKLFATCGEDKRMPHALPPQWNPTKFLSGRGQEKHRDACRPSPEQEPKN